MFENQGRSRAVRPAERENSSVSQVEPSKKDGFLMVDDETVRNILWNLSLYGGSLAILATLASKIL